MDVDTLQKLSIPETGGEVFDKRIMRLQEQR